MCKAILTTLETVLGDQWTPEVARAWADLWDAASSTMVTVRTYMRVQKCASAKTTKIKPTQRGKPFEISLRLEQGDGRWFRNLCAVRPAKLSELVLLLLVVLASIMVIVLATNSPVLARPDVQ